MGLGRILRGSDDWSRVPMDWGPAVKQDPLPPGQPADVVNFEVGAWSHMHWVDRNGVVRPPFTPDCVEVYLPGKRCDACPPEQPGRTMTIVSVDRTAGTITYAPKEPDGG